eukprot:14096301-Alexandrium_andersonii.AAC.1
MGRARRAGSTPAAAGRPPLPRVAPSGSRPLAPGLLHDHLMPLRRSLSMDRCLAAPPAWSARRAASTSWQL